MIDQRDEQLIAQYLEADMSDEDFARFQQRLRDDRAVRERLRAQLNLEAGLRDWAAGDSRLTQLWAGVGSRSVSLSKTVAPRWIAAAILAAACVVVAALWLGSGESLGAATLLHSGGDVVIVDADGNPRDVASGAVIQPGDTIETGGGESFARIAFADGTWVLIVDHSSVSLDRMRPKGITLRSGRLSASVAKQPDGQPMVIATPQHVAKVLGTEFALEASPDHTDLHVRKGRVRLTRTKDGKSVLVPQGKRVVSDALGPDLVLQDSGEAGDAWEEDFEDGLPRDWQRGKLVKEGLPEGSSGAVSSEYYAPWDSYLIDSPTRWIGGLFVVQADTHVHFTFKMQHPDWLNVFCMARTNVEQDPMDLFLCNTAPFRRAEPGKWYTMSIPIGAWKRKDDVHGRGFVDPPPKAGETVYAMSWSSSKVDRGLVIDRVWVTRGGTGKIELNPLDKGKPNEEISNED